MNKKKILIALSGGVDSSVAAHLLIKEGYECVGATMKLLDNADDNVASAKAVADHLGIPFYCFDLRQEFFDLVIKPFAQSYQNGGTPNPCIVCNKQLKFGLLLQKADELGCDFIATGHYAKVENENGNYYLEKAENKEKDQSYFLYSLTPEVLSRVLFPLGNYSKPQIREIAENLGLVTAKKSDSQDICFVPDGNYADIVRGIIGDSCPKGNFVDTYGNVLGTHQGIINYTIGQRKGLGIALGQPAYVLEKRKDTNEVVLCSDAELFKSELTATDFNWMTEKPSDTISCKARIRYRHQEQPATVTILGDRVKVVFMEPQRAITAGQSVVLYDGDKVLGGGIIE